MNPLKIGFLLCFAFGCALASASADEGKIFVYNEGAYSAKFSVSYDLKGESKSYYSEELKHGENQYISIPSEAANIHLKVEKLGLKGFQTIFTKDFPSPPQKCYKLNGTLLSSGYEEISCLNVKMQNSREVSKSHEVAEVGGHILIEDNAEKPVPVSLSYKLNGIEKSIKDILSRGVNVKINIQKGATNVQLKIGDDFKQDFPGAVTKCYGVSDADQSLKVEEIPCSLKTVHSPQVTRSKNASENAGSITVENASGSVITFSVSYDVNGKSESVSSGDFSLGVKKTIPIPSGATSILFELKAYWLPGLVTTVFTQSFPAPVVKCYRYSISAVMQCPLANEVI